MQDVSRIDLVRKGLKPIQSIRRIGEHYVKLLMADAEKIEHIVPDHRDIVQPQPSGLGLDERSVLPRHLDRPDPRRSPGGELERHRSGTPEKIQYLKTTEIVLIVKHIEKSLHREIGGRPGLVAGRWIDCLAPQLSSYDPHSLSTDLK